MNAGITAINEEVERRSAFVQPLLGEMGKVVIGQRMLVERLIIGLLANGHVLLEGVPGLAKTLSIKSLAQCMDADFARLQFCLLYTSPSPRDKRQSRMPSSA